MSQVSADDRTGREYVRESLLTGTAIVVPVLLTIVVLLFGLNFLAGLLAPLAVPIHQVLGRPGEPGLFATGLAALVLGTVIVLVGTLAESERTDLDVEGGVDATMARLPGIGSIYSTLNQLSDILVESDTDSFQEVVLVEFPAQQSFSVAFKTAETPDVIDRATTGEDMTTVFMPMGPNPVMGGFVLHVSDDRVYDVDLSVEEGISSIVSFGVAVDQEATDGSGEFR